MTHYRDLVAALVKPGEDIRRSLSALDAHQLHMTMGICGESGELLDAFKKAIIYRKPLDRDNVIEELGDLEFYMEGLRQSLDLTRTEVLEANRQKLMKRYQSGSYSDNQAQERADKKPDYIAIDNIIYPQFGDNK